VPWDLWGLQVRPPPATRVLRGRQPGAASSHGPDLLDIWVSAAWPKTLHVTRHWRSGDRSTPATVARPVGQDADADEGRCAVPLANARVVSVPAGLRLGARESFRVAYFRARSLFKQRFQDTMADPEISIDSPEALEEWLKDKPTEWAQAIAARVVLRVLPVALGVTALPDGLVNQTLKKAILLSVVRVSFAFFSALKGKKIYSERYWEKSGIYIEGCESKFREVLNFYNVRERSKFEIFTVLDFFVFVKGAIRIQSLNSISLNRQHSSDLSVLIDQLARDFTPEADTWTAVESDARFLEGHRQGASALMEQPLWQQDVRRDGKHRTNSPVWARQAFASFTQSDLVTRGPWHVVVDWYRGVLPSTPGNWSTSPFGEKADVEIATQPDAFWERDPDVVMRDIERIVDGKRPLFDPDAARSETADAPEEPERAEASFGASGVSDPPETLEAGEVQGSDAEPRDGARETPSPVAVDSSTTRETGTVSDPPAPADVTTQFDHPTADDQLGRRPFADTLVEYMRALQATGGPDGFAVNLHGPWGAGKTSILLMMEEFLARPKDAGEPAWAVVHFNAWEHERRNPPWWPLIEAVKDGCIASLNRSGEAIRAGDVRHKWREWVFKAEWLRYVVAVFLFGIGISAVVFSDDQIAKSFGVVLAIVTAAFAGSRSLLQRVFFGSMSNEEFYLKVAKDPMKRVCQLFRDLVETSERSVCIVIDDLDRCNADYVVDLLEGIQTSFRHENVAYVVAADKTWIRAAFEKRYPDFAEHVGEVGQPLGYLFLEKIFQMSVPVPGMGTWKRSYLRGLLRGSEAVAAPVSAPSSLQTADDETRVDPDHEAAARRRAFDDAVATRRKEFQEKHGNEASAAALEEELKTTREDDAVSRAAFAMEFATSRRAARETEHLLLRFADLLPENPRVMKRMINAFGMRYATAMLVANDLPRAVLARWTVLEQRYPALADLLVDHPDAVDLIAAGSNESKDIPEAIRPFADVPAVRDILLAPLTGPGGAEIAAPPLDAEAVRSITRGAVG